MTKKLPKGADEPLIAALLTRLPRPGQAWSRAERVAWLRMLAGAFDVVYGAQAPIGIDAAVAVVAPADELPNPVAPRRAPAPVAPAAPTNGDRPPHVANGCDFYVDPDGYVRCDHDNVSGIASPSPGRRVLPAEVDGHPIYEYRGTRRNRETVIWADDSQGAGPGMEFCGPG